jgi:hypothetical protein
VSIVIGRGGATVRVLLDAAMKGSSDAHEELWDGKDDSGLLVDPAEYTVEIHAESDAGQESATGTIHVVRIGAVEIDMTGDDNYAIMYHKKNGVGYSYYPVDDPEWRIGEDSGSEFSDMDTNDGVARPGPQPWEELSHPPQDADDPDGVEDDNHSLPACFRMGGLPVLRLTLGQRCASQQSNGAVDAGYPIDGLPLRVTAVGFDTSEDENVAPGTTTTIAAEEPLPTSVGAGISEVDLVFEYFDGEAWVELPGVQHTSHLLYRTFGPPRLAGNTAPSMPWVAVLDTVTGIVSGDASTAVEVIEDVVEHVLTDEGLIYDLANGVHHFVDLNYYPSGGQIVLDSVLFDLTAYLDRQIPATINCSDSASILSTYLSMLGIDAYYFQIWNSDYYGNGIRLNYIKVVGTTEFLNVPTYGGDAWGYHAIVTTEPDNSHVSDSCIYLDGDGDPASQPCTDLVPTYVPFEEYLALLTPEPDRIMATDKVKCGLR